MNELKAAALKYAQEENDRHGRIPGHDGETLEAFMAGAAWQRQQILKDLPNGGYESSDGSARLGSTICSHGAPTGTNCEWCNVAGNYALVKPVAETQESRQVPGESDPHTARLVAAAQGWVRLGDTLKMASPQFNELRNALKSFEQAPDDSPRECAHAVPNGENGRCAACDYERAPAQDGCTFCGEREGGYQHCVAHAQDVHHHDWELLGFEPETNCCCGARRETQNGCADCAELRRHIPDDQCQECLKKAKPCEHHLRFHRGCQQCQEASKADSQQGVVQNHDPSVQGWRSCENPKCDTSSFYNVSGKPDECPECGVIARG